VRGVGAAAVPAAAAGVAGGVLVQRVEDVREHELVDRAGPQEVEVLVVRDLLGLRVARQLLQHHVDVDQAVRAAVHEHDGRLDVARRELGDLVVLVPVRDGQRCFVVVHLEHAVADDLEPVDHAFGGREGVEVRVRR